jgi:hypothetical protein
MAAFIAQPLSNSEDLLPAGVCNSSRETGYFRSEHNSIVAITLTSGNVIWESFDAAVPLMASDHVLIAADFRYWKIGQFQAAILNPETGVLKIRSRPIDVGQSPKTSADSFPALESVLEGERILIRWETTSPDISGVPPPVQRANRAPKHVIHSVVLNPTDGSVEELPLQVETGTGIDVPANSVAYRRRGDWKKGPWDVDLEVINLVLPGGSILSKTELDIVPRGTTQRKFSVHLPPGTPYVSANGRHVLIMPREPKTEKSKVYRSTDGREVARLTLDPTLQDWAIVGSRFLYTRNVPGGSRTVERVITSVDLSSGQSIWSYRFGEKPIAPPPRLPQ